MFTIIHPARRMAVRGVHHANRILVTARAFSSPAQRAVTTCGFAFISREEEEACPMPYGSRRSLRARRKEAFQHDRIMFRVPRTHCEEHGPWRKSGARDEGTCPLFLLWGHVAAPLCVARAEGPEAGVNCQLLDVCPRPDTADPPGGRIREDAPLCGLPRVASYRNASTAGGQHMCTYGIDSARVLSASRQ